MCEQLSQLMLRVQVNWKVCVCVSAYRVWIISNDNTHTYKTTVYKHTQTDRCVYTWRAVLVCRDAVTKRQRLRLLPSELGPTTGALLLLAAQRRGALLGGWPQRCPPLHLQSLELLQGTLQAEAEHARHAGPEINQVPGAVCLCVFVCVRWM